MSRTCPSCWKSYAEEILPCPEDGLDLSSVGPDDELIGRSIGSYRVVKPLGKGGMGAVYMAEHPKIGSKVAIKFLHPQYATERKIVDRFFNRGARGQRHRARQYFEDHRFERHRGQPSLLHHGV